MNRERDLILAYVEARLAPLDHVTRRHALRALLRNGSLLALLAGTDLLVPAASDAQQRRTISREALTAPAPDRAFGDFRTQLAEGKRALLEQIIREAMADVAAGVDPGRVFPGPGRTDACGTSFTCGSNECAQESCSGTNTCGTQSCGGLACPGRNSCDSQSCSGLRASLTPSGFLSRYRDERFVRELSDLFGRNVEQEIESMIRTGATLRQRGLLGPAVQPPPSIRPFRDRVRDLAGERLRRIPPAAPPAAPPAKPVR